MGAEPMPQSGATRPGSGAGTASVLAFEADRLVVSASTEADGILVLSEVAYPGWQATIDGRPTPIFVADGLLRP